MVLVIHTACVCEQEQVNNPRFEHQIAEFDTSAIQ
jgi:hypothetical protein